MAANRGMQEIDVEYSVVILQARGPYSVHFIYTRGADGVYADVCAVSSERLMVDRQAGRRHI